MAEREHRGHGMGGGRNPLTLLVERRIFLVFFGNAEVGRQRMDKKSCTV